MKQRRVETPRNRLIRKSQFRLVIQRFFSSRRATRMRMQDQGRWRQGREIIAKINVRIMHNRSVAGGAFAGDVPRWPYDDAINSPIACRCVACCRLCIYRLESKALIPLDVRNQTLR